MKSGFFFDVFFLINLCELSNCKWTELRGGQGREEDPQAVDAFSVQVCPVFVSGPRRNLSCCHHGSGVRHDTG